MYMQQTSTDTCYFKHNISQYLSSVLQLETFKSLNVLYVTLSNSLDLPFNSVHRPPCMVESKLVTS